MSRMMASKGFFHNALRQHLDELVDQDLVEGGKRPSERGPGKPLFTYRLNEEDEKVVSAQLDPSMGLVVNLL
jgi:predicted ArsR family transcriptional regulator